MMYRRNVIATGLQLGEGCIWDQARNKVHFVDIEGFTIYSCSLHDGTIEEFNMGDYVGCIALNDQGDLIAAVRNKIIRLNLSTGRQETVMQISLPAYIRFNDGKLDPSGNLWVGTMAIDQTDPKAHGAGSLYCIKEGRVISKYEGFTISNGLVWNPSGDKFYHIDTPTQKIDVYDVVEEGVLGNKKTAVSIDEKEGAPDGMCMDSRGQLWVAMWGGGKVHCYNPDTGAKMKEVLVPDRNVSCCIIGGADKNLLFVTTAQNEHKNSGKVYMFTRDPIQEEWY
ncbi:SMP-30/gluconolactonase/LRE family protein [uncultured Robinsoniella sp.]|uniref:SMP-30/gluconolactonase/LRE family protein n=1 Tax=uncultured Robinsoniella sp. TaxID=904190 RepID=UPI00374F44CB